MACARDFYEFINCDICFEVFNNPQSLICRHIFCLKCVDKIKDASKIECPVCKVKSNVCDIKPDYRTVAMVDSFHTKESATEEKDHLISKCEQCEDDTAEITHKCETCDLLLCDKCEASHTASATDGSTCTSKAISALAGDMRAEINKTLKHLKTQEEILATKLSNGNKELEDIRQTSDNAMKSITEKEENLMAKIKSHHDNLRKEVGKEKAKHVKESKKENKSIEVCYHDVKGRQAMLKTWVNDRSDRSIVNTTEHIQKQLQGIEKESTKNQDCCTSVKNFTVNIIEGNEWDTKLTFSTNQSTDGRESDEDDATGSEAAVSILSDYTKAEHRDYKAEKTVEVAGDSTYYKRIDNIQQYNGHLYCMTEERIHVYKTDLQLVKTIKLNHNGWVDCTAFAYVNDKHLITASKSIENGLRVLDTDGKDIQRIFKGEFYGLVIHNHKLYAYEYKINKVLIFEQTLDYFWKQSGEIYLNYNGDNEHKAKAITSFLMENEQIYITDDTSIYHLDMKGKIKRKINQRKTMTKLKNPKICSVDSLGNLVVIEPENKTLSVVRTDGKCVEFLTSLSGCSCHGLPKFKGL